MITTYLTRLVATGRILGISGTPLFALEPTNPEPQELSNQVAQLTADGTAAHMPVDFNLTEVLTMAVTGEL